MKIRVIFCLVKCLLRNMCTSKIFSVFSLTDTGWPLHRASRMNQPQKPAQAPGATATRRTCEQRTPGCSSDDREFSLLLLFFFLMLKSQGDRLGQAGTQMMLSGCLQVLHTLLPVCLPRRPLIPRPPRCPLGGVCGLKDSEKW